MFSHMSERECESAAKEFTPCKALAGLKNQHPVRHLQGMEITRQVVLVSIIFVSIVTKSSSLVLFSFSSLMFIAILLGRSKSSSQDFDPFSYLPTLDCEVEYQFLVSSKEEDHKIHDNEDSLPRLVNVKKEEPLLLEYVHEVEKEEPLLLEYFHDAGDGFQESEGGHGDNDDVNREDEREEEFERRIEEFIAKNIEKWREELLNEKLLRITL